MKIPFDPSDFCYFLKRVGEEDIAKIFSYNVHIHGVEVQKQEKFALSAATELSFGRKTTVNQCFNGSDCLEFEENNGKIERKIFVFHFSTIFPFLYRKCHFIAVAEL